MIARIPLLVLALTASGCVSAQRASGPACLGSAEQNRRIVTEFYTMALVDKQVRAGFEKFVRLDFVEHKPDIEGGNREGAIRFLEGMVKEVPGAQWQVRRSLAEADLVAVHASFAPGAGSARICNRGFFPARELPDRRTLGRCRSTRNRQGQPQPALLSGSGFRGLSA